jgi:hypothetical protein
MILRHNIHSRIPRTIRLKLPFAGLWQLSLNWLPCFYCPAFPSFLLVSSVNTSLIIIDTWIFFLGSAGWGIWLLICKGRIITNLPFKIDVEIGSHSSSPSSVCTHTNSSINDGCNGTSVNESSYNNREREMFSEFQETDSLSLSLSQNYLSIFIKFRVVQLLHVQSIECQISMSPTLFIA